MKKMLLISCAIVSSFAVANQPQKNEDYSFYAQCIKPNIDLIKTKFKEHKPTIEKHTKTLHSYYTEFSKTTEYSLAKNCIGFALLADLFRPRVYAHSHLKYITQLATGLYFTAPIAKQFYADMTKKK